MNKDIAFHYVYDVVEKINFCSIDYFCVLFVSNICDTLHLTVDFFHRNKKAEKIFSAF
jgi:hypothetical protein